MWGGLPIGQTDSPQAITTPVDLVDEDTAFVLHPKVTNICRLLQFLDEDGNPENGIRISKETRDRIQALVDQGLTINYSLAPGELDGNDLFYNQAGISDIVTALNASPSVFTDETTGNPVTKAFTDKKTANTHFFNTMAANLMTSVVLVNLGDSLTAGAQSGIGNIHSGTQANSYAGNIAYQVLSLAYEDMEWNYPSMTVDIEDDVYKNDQFNRTYYRVKDKDADAEDPLEQYLVPYNLGVPGATIKDVLETTTTAPVDGVANAMITELYHPIPEMVAQAAEGDNYITGDRTEITQLEAALFLANQEDNAAKLKLFTLWIGMEDTLGVVTENMGEDLSFATITQFLADHADYEADLYNIVNQLSSQEYSYVFIGTIPDVRTLGILFSRDDIEKMVAPLYAFADENTDDDPDNDIAPPDLTASGMTSELIGFKAFVGDYLNPDPDDADHPSLTRSLTPAAGEAKLNQNIAKILTDDASFLSAAEIAAINTRIDAINQYIKNLPALIKTNTGRENVVVVDVAGEVYDDLLDTDNGFDIYSLIRDADRAPDKDTYINEYDYNPYLFKHMAGRFYSFDGYHPGHTGYGTIGFTFMNKIAEAEIGLDLFATYEYLGETYDALELEITDVQQLDPYTFDEDGDGFMIALPYSTFNPFHSYDAATLGGFVDCNGLDETILPYYVGGFQYDPNAVPNPDDDSIDYGYCEGYMPEKADETE